MEHFFSSGNTWAKNAQINEIYQANLFPTSQAVGPSRESLQVVRIPIQNEDNFPMLRINLNDLRNIIEVATYPEKAPAGEFIIGNESKE